MATVIDELIVELKLDPKQFDQASKDQVGKLRQFEHEHERHSKKMAKDTDSLTQAFSLLQGRLLAIAGLFMGGMGISQFTEHITKLTAQTGFLANSLGISTTEITKWQGVGATVGATAGEMAQAVASIRQGQADIQIGRQSGLSAFSYMTHQANQGPAVDIFDSKGNQRSGTDVLMDISRWLQSQKEKGPEATNNATRTLSSLLGMGQGTINTLMLGPDELRKRLAEMEKFAPTQNQIRKFTELQEAFGKLEQSSQALGRAFIEKLQPTILLIIQLLDKLANILHPASDEKIKEFTDKHVPEMGGSRSIFGRIKSWWNGGDKATESGVATGGGAGSSPGGVGGGTSTQTPPAASGGGAANDNVGAGLGGSEFLKARRKRMMDEINANPDLRRKVAAMVVTEGAKDPVPVIESLFNRADYEGKTINEMLTPRFYGPMRRGELPAAAAQLDRNPQLNARMQRAIETVGAGSHIIGGYTDQGLRTDPNGMHQPQMQRGGNIFTDWGGGRGGHAGAAAYRRMIESGIARDSTRPGPDAAIPGGGNAGAFDRWRQINRLSGADAAMRSSQNNTVNNNTRSNQTSIGNMTVTVPPGSDPAGYARGISQELQRFDPVMNANEGLL